MINAQQIAELDKKDKLKDFRHQFIHAYPELIYLDGNSLGKITARSRENLQHVIDYQWSERLIRSWNEGWYELPQKLAAKLARIIGAQAHEVLIADNTSINLYKLAIAALQLKADRKQIISDHLNFPTDLYILQGIIDTLKQGHYLDLMPADDGMTLDVTTVKDFVNNNTGLVTLSHVAFKSAFLYQMQQINEIVHSQGALVLWDLSHSAGAVPINLNASEADMAIGCTYKFLNGGPGAPAFLYVSEKLQTRIKSPIWGWFGDAKPFDFSLQYEAAPGIKNFASGTPPILSLSALEHSLDLITRAGIENIREKSVQLTELIKELSNTRLLPLGFSIGSPLQAEQRGSHFSLKHKEAYRICQALISKEVGEKVIIPDFRAPDNIRLGVSPLYNNFEEVYQTVLQIEAIVKNEWYAVFDMKPQGVT